ncbi:MAG: acyl carrier protein [Novosphingobium sp. 12-63-9]|nr:MAG: acyl carrier protein [Novosphingobium sp. 12-63-9]
MTDLAAQDTDTTLRAILRDVLGLSAERAAALESDTGLFGAMPELDSMAVAGLLTEMEDRFDIVIDDDEVDGEMLETYGNLLAFAADKRAAATGA